MEMELPKLDPANAPKITHEPPDVYVPLALTMPQTSGLLSSSHIKTNAKNAPSMFCVKRFGISVTLTKTSRPRTQFEYC
jgi:hypothetical protein